MSTIKTDTLSNLSGSKTANVTNVLNGYAHAWANFDGTGTPSIRASYNVLSLTDHGVGDWTVNLINALPDANFCAIGVGTLNGSTSPGDQARTLSPRSYTNNSVRFVVTDGVSGSDLLYCNIVIHR